MSASATSGEDYPVFPSNSSVPIVLSGFVVCELLPNVLTCLDSGQGSAPGLDLIATALGERSVEGDRFKGLGVPASVRFHT